MSWLTVNGIEIPALVDSASESRREIGETSPSFNGTMRKSRQSTKRDISFETPPLSGADAHAWDMLLRGVGEQVSFFDTFYSSKGLGPSVGYTAELSGGMTYHLGFGFQMLFFDGAKTISYAADLGLVWTVAVWYGPDGDYHHYLVDSDGRKWVDGVRNDGASTTFISVSSGTCTLTGNTVFADSLLLLPYLVPTTWPPVLGTATTAFSDLPELFLSGDVVPEASSRTAFGEVSLKVVRTASANNERVLSVSFSEV